MLQKVKGIVLHHLPFGDTSIIVHLYTDLYGRQSVMIRGARGQKKNRKISLYHPLALLEMELYYKESRDLQSIKEAKPIVPLHGLMTDPLKNTIALFIAEVLYRSIRETESNPDLFSFLSHNIEYFDLQEHGQVNFHLSLLCHLTRYLGFRPHIPKEAHNTYFDLITGSFTLLKPIHQQYVDREASVYLHQIFSSSPAEIETLKIPRATRNILIEKLLFYYDQQLDGQFEIRSYEILKSVFQ